MVTRRAAACLLCAAAFCARAILLAETAPPEVAAAAESGLPDFLAKIPPDGLRDYGFAPGDPLGDAYPGAPYRLREITPAALSTFSPTDTVGSLTRATSIWYFPVMLGGEAKAILIVDLLDGAWRAVSLGQAALAGELNEIGRQWPAAKGYDLRLIVSFQAASYFFSVPQAGDRNLTRIATRGAAAPRAPGRGYAATSGLASTIEALRPAVEENIRQVQ